MYPNINLEIQITILPRYNGDRQSIWSRWRSNEESKDGDSLVKSVKSYQQVKSPPGGGLPNTCTDKSTKRSTDKSAKTHQQVYREVLPRSQKYAEWQVYQVNKVPTEATCWECNHEVNQIVTKEDFKRRLPSKCHLPMTSGCKIYPPEPAEALHRAQTALARLN